MAERFWMQQALKAQNDACSPSNTQPQSPTYNPRVDTDARSVVSRGETSVAPSGYTSKTSVRLGSTLVILFPLLPVLAMKHSGTWFGVLTCKHMNEATLLATCTSFDASVLLQYLSERLQRLEAELATERESRKRVEADLETLKTKLTH